MYQLGREKVFYKAPDYPPWAFLPLTALSPDLHASKSLLPPATPTSISTTTTGSFIPLWHYDATKPDTVYRDPHTTMSSKADVYLFNNKYPVSRQLINWGSLKSYWDLSEKEREKVEKRRKGKDKRDWIEGFRWSCMESYLKHLHAFAVYVLHLSPSLTQQF